MVCAFEFGGRVGVAQSCFMPVGLGLRVWGRAQVVRALGLVGWGWSGVVCA